MADTASPRSPGARPWLAWAVIAACTLLFGWRAFADKQGTADDGPPPVSDTVLEIEARALLAQRAQGPAGSDLDVRGALAQVAEGRLRQRLQVTVLFAELLGPAEAAQEIERTQEYVARARGGGKIVRPEDARALDLLRELYAPPPGGEDAAAAVAARADALVEDDREHLAETLGWIGELATLPAGVADAERRRRVLSETVAKGNVMLLGLGGGICGLLAVGSGLALLAMILTVARKMEWRLDPPDAADGVLLEVFAAWLVIMCVAPLADWLLPDLDTWGSVAALGLSPAALLWGRRRGLAWPELRRRLGLHRGRGLLREAGAGVLAYLGGLPALAIGVALTAGLAKLLEGGPISSDGSHPMVEALGAGGAGRFVFILVVASVIAPLLEETFFRGALYGHLRGGSRARMRVLSVLGCAAFSGFLFAAVHPQSVVAIPALAAIGFSLALAREWRDSLVAPMVAHGLSNGIVITIVWIALG